MQYTWKKSACPYDCPDGCGLLLKTDGTTIYEVKADPDHPVTKGFICRKMQQYEKTIHNPDRILTPLKRTGKKGSKEFAPISWEEAIEIITTKWKEIIEKHGSEAILPYSYAGTEHAVQNKCGEAFFNQLGASLLDRTICSKAKSLGLQQILGGTQGRNPSVLIHDDVIVIWGCNVAATYLHAYAEIKKAKKQGAKVILIETYETPSAAIADEVVLVRPGSDGALALGIAKAMVENGWINYDFLKEYAFGWEEYINEIQTYDLADIANTCGIEKDKMIELAKLLGTAKHPSIIIGSGLSRHGNGAMMVRSIISLQAFTGALIDPVAGIIGCLSSSGYFGREMIQRSDFLTKEVRLVNMNQLGDALTSLEPPVYSLYVYNVNPANVAPDQKKVLEGLQREDLFTVVHERFMTDTAAYADIILPADTSAEHTDICTPYGHFFAQLTEKVIPPLGEAKCNWDTFCLLAKGMGFEDDFWDMTNEEAVQYILDHSDKLKELWSKEEWDRFLNHEGVLLPVPDPTVFATPSGKIELLNPALCEEDQLPHLKENYGGDYPLRLVTAPHLQSLNSTFQERSDLLEKRGTMCLMLHP